MALSEVQILNLRNRVYRRSFGCGVELRTGYDLKTAKSINLMLAEWPNRGLINGLLSKAHKQLLLHDRLQLEL